MRLLTLALFLVACGAKPPGGAAPTDTSTTTGTPPGTLPANGVQQIGAGDHNCALLPDGAMRCWGVNWAGQLGYGNTEPVGDDELPVSAGDVAVGGVVAQVGPGYDHNCVLLDTGEVRCWGRGGARIGLQSSANVGDDELPDSVSPVDVGAVATQLAVGEGFNCVLTDVGAVRCWGENYNGELGLGNEQHVGDDEPPSAAPDTNLGGPVAALALTDGEPNHMCALLQDGAVRCWGNGGAHLGIRSMQAVGDDEPPASAPPVDVGGTVTQLAVAGGVTCALLDTGNVRCWGWNGAGRLGYGHTQDIGDDETPAQAGDVDVGGAVTQIAVGAFHTCALLDTGAVRCWGDNEHGRLGYGTYDDVGDDETPASAGDVPLGGPAVQLAVGTAHTCALMATGAVRCWGKNTDGVLGYGHLDDIGDNETAESAGDVPLL